MMLGPSGQRGESEKLWAMSPQCAVDTWQLPVLILEEAAAEVGASGWGEIDVWIYVLLPLHLD